MGRYIEKSDIESQFGRRNVAAWSRLDNTQSPEVADATRVAAIIAKTEDYIDDRLRGYIYAIPMTGTIPRTIVDIAAKLAGADLYQARGMEDFNAESDNPMEGHKKDAETTLNRILRGEIRLDVDTAGTHPSVAVVPEVMDDGDGWTSQARSGSAWPLW